MTRPARKPLAALVAVALVTGAALAIACSSGGDQPPTSTPATPATGETPSSNATPITSPEEALARYVQRLNQGFVADCDKAKRPDDVGKQCAHKLGERGDLVAYTLGPTFSNPTRILILKPEAGDWTLVSIENLDQNQPFAPGIPWPLEAGAHVVVAGTAPDCLKIRAAPGIGSAQLDSQCINDGTTVTVVAGPVAQDNIDWWQLENLGWAAGAYLRYPDAGPTATVTPD
jgi:hypothetical protein